MVGNATIASQGLDAIDLQLIDELHLDGRASQSALGLKVGLSQTAVRRRINRLLDSGILRITAIVNPAVLGIEWMGIVGLSVRESSREIAAELAEITGVGNVFIASGRYDVVVELRCRSKEQFLDLIEAVRSDPGVADVEAVTYLQVVKESVFMPTAEHSPVLDALDLAVVHELEKDGRQSYAELAPKVGLSETAVRARVLQLLETGAITVTGLVDRVALGLELESAFTLEVSGSVREATAKVAEIPEVAFLAITAGPYDAVGNLSCESREHALETADRIRAIPGIRTVTSLPFLRTVRESYPSVASSGLIPS